MLKRAREMVVEHVVVTAAAGLNQRVCWCRVRLGLQSDSRADAGIVREDVGHVGQLVGADVSVAVARIRVGQSRLLLRIGSALLYDTAAPTALRA